MLKNTKHDIVLKWSKIYNFYNDCQYFGERKQDCIRKLDSDTMMFKIVEHKVNITFDA